MATRNISHLLLIPVLGILSTTGMAQNELYNRGDNIYVQGGGLVHVQGEVINANNGPTVGRVFNSGNIQLTGNWTNNSTSNVFQAFDPGTTTFLGNSALQTVGGTADTYFNNLTINKPGGVRELRLLRNSLSDGILALNDDFLNTQTFTHLVANPNPAAITRLGPVLPNTYTSSVTEGYITSTVGSAGRLARSTSNAFAGAIYLFPVGTSTRFRPVEITPTSTGTNVYAVQFVNVPPFSPNARAATLATINPAWYHFIERAAPTGSPENIRIYHDFTADDVCDINSVTLSEWNLSQWADLSPTVSVQNVSPQLSWTQKTGYPGSYPTPWMTNSFALAGLFIIPGVSSCVFPVELLELEADPLQSTILVSWKTASQTANAGWFVERSENGRDFHHIGWVTGAGTTTQTMDYELEDQDVRPGVLYYYRLRQQDMMGAENLSQVVTAMLPKDGLTIGDLYPNPSTGMVYLPISSPEALDLQLDVVNMLGQEVMTDVYAIRPGYQEITFDLSLLAKGVYQISLSARGFVKSKKLVLE